MSHKPHISNSFSSQNTPRYKEKIGSAYPRTASNPNQFLEEKISWKVNSLDFDGTHGWNRLEDIKVLYLQVVTRMKLFEAMTWQEIIDTGSHPINVADIIKEAQKRLDALGIYEDQLFSFRITGKKRMWGIRDRHIFKILWWDPDHKICPSPKKNT